MTVTAVGAWWPQQTRSTVHTATNKIAKFVLIISKCDVLPLPPSTALYQLAASRRQVTIVRIKRLLGNEIRGLGSFLPCEYRLWSPGIKGEIDK